MLYFGEFPPIVTFHMSLSPNIEYQFIYNLLNVGHIQVQPIDNNSCRPRIHILDITRDRSCPSDFNQEHVGTEIFNAAMLDMYSKWDIVPSKITGKLSTGDISRWEKSIPFYRDFPKWLAKNLPYSLQFHLYSDKAYRNEIFIPEDKQGLRSFIMESLIPGNQDWYFAYSVEMNE